MLLKLVHANVCYIDTKLHTCSQYFVTLIDDCNQKLWASVLKTNDQVLLVFKDFQARVEREIGWKLKAI